MRPTLRLIRRRPRPMLQQMAGGKPIADAASPGSQAISPRRRQHNQYAVPNFLPFLTMKVLDIPSTGKRGQTVAYLSPYGLCHRALVVPKNTLTAASSHVRGAFGAYARAWSHTLTQQQRDAWHAAGPQVKSAKRLTSGHLTGQLLFQSINTVRARVGLLSPLLYPPEPVVFSPNPVGQLDISNGPEGVRLFLNLAHSPTENIMVYGQAPCSSGRRKRRRVVYLGLLPAPDAGRSEITALYTARFGEPHPGERLFIVTRQQKDGWQAAEHETTEIVPPKPPPASAATTQSAPHPVAMHTGCTTVAHRTGAPPTPNLPTGNELSVPEVAIVGPEAIEALAVVSADQPSGVNGRPGASALLAAGGPTAGRAGNPGGHPSGSGAIRAVDGKATPPRHRSGDPEGAAARLAPGQPGLPTRDVPATLTFGPWTLDSRLS